MKKVAIFGNAGGGKSTLARQLAARLQLPLHVIDCMQYRAGGSAVPHEDYLRVHDEILGTDTWIIDGFGCPQSLWARLAAADTLIHVDLPLHTHVLWVTKRFVKGLFVDPQGWPDHSPMFRSTLSSYRVIWLCHRRLTPRYRQYVAQARQTRNVHHLRSAQAIREFPSFL